MEVPSLRELLDKHAYPAKWAAGSLIAVCLMAIAVQLFGGHGRGTRRTDQLFYSDDDGKTWFADDASKGSPFDHHGRPAYRAWYFAIRGARVSWRISRNTPTSRKRKWMPR